MVTELVNPTSAVIVGLFAIITLFFGLVFRGHLVPRRQLEDYRDDRDKWQIAYEQERVAGASRDRQIEKLLEGSTLTVDLLRGLRDAARGAP